MVRRSSGMASYPQKYGRSAPTDRSKTSTPRSAIASRARSMRWLNTATGYEDCGGRAATGSAPSGGQGHGHRARRGGLGGLAGVVAGPG